MWIVLCTTPTMPVANRPETVDCLCISMPDKSPMQAKPLVDNRLPLWIKPGARQSQANGGKQ
jgi:hypothetical protein